LGWGMAQWMIDTAIEVIAGIGGFFIDYPLLGISLLVLLWCFRRFVKILLYYAICIGSMIAFYRLIYWAVHAVFGPNHPIPASSHHLDFLNAYEPLASWVFIALVLVGWLLIVIWAIWTHIQAKATAADLENSHPDTPSAPTVQLAPPQDIVAALEPPRAN
jgi:hypothetical protein